MAAIRNVEHFVQAGEDVARAIAKEADVPESIAKSVLAKQATNLAESGVESGIKRLASEEAQGSARLLAKGKVKPLLLEAPSGSNPWLNESNILSMTAPKDFKINMVMADKQMKPGGWGTLDNILDATKVQQYIIPEGTRIQIGTAGLQKYDSVIYPGGGNQVQILNYLDGNKLIPIGTPLKIK